MASEGVGDEMNIFCIPGLLFRDVCNYVQRGSIWTNLCLSRLKYDPATLEI